MEAPEVWARLYILDKQFKAAEAIYLEHNQLDEAIYLNIGPILVKPTPIIISVH